MRRQLLIRTRPGLLNITPVFRHPIKTSYGFFFHTWPTTFRLGAAGSSLGRTLGSLHSRPGHGRPLYSIEGWMEDISVDSVLVLALSDDFADFPMVVGIRSLIEVVVPLKTLEESIPKTDFRWWFMNHRAYIPSRWRLPLTPFHIIYLCTMSVYLNRVDNHIPWFT